MILENFEQLTCTNSTLLGAAENRILPWAMEFNPTTIVSGVDHAWCSFGVVSNQAFTFSCEGSILGSFGTFDTLFSIAVLAAVYTQTFDLPAPQGDDGRFQITRPYVRFRAVNGGVLSTSFRAMVRVWSA